MTNDQIRMTKQAPGVWAGLLVSSFVIWISSWFRNSRFRHSDFPISLCRYSRFRYSLFLLCFLQACTNTPTVLLKSINSPQALKVGFARAFFSPSQTGEDQIVLLSDPIDAPTDASPGDPLAAATSPPLWQVLCISLHWRTSASPKLDALVASNAVLHFYVYGKPTGHDVAVVHYIGSGSVSIDVDSTGAQVSINHAQMKLADRFGQINDPFRQFQITGNFRAQTDAGAAQQTMDDVHKAILEATHGSPAASSRP